MNFPTLSLVVRYWGPSGLQVTNHNFMAIEVNSHPAMVNIAFRADLEQLSTTRQELLAAIAVIDTAIKDLECHEA